VGYSAQIILFLVQYLRHQRKESSTMNNLINKLLKVLKEHVIQNNNEIQFNQEEIDKLLSDEKLSTRKKDLDSKYFLNRQLLNENSDFIKMQLELSEFVEKYKHLFPISNSDSSMKLSDENELQKLFLQTVTGKVQFDQSHPQYNNQRFLDELIKYYESNENYEMCEKLLKLRDIS
jgi:septum formation topological specificity factor MinE